MATLLYFLTVAVMAQTNINWKADLKEKIPCQPTSLRGQASLLRELVGGDTLSALKNQKFKHLSQYSLFIAEFQQLSTIRAAVKGPGPGEEERAKDTIRLFSEFAKEDGFFDPDKVCTCAASEGTRELDAKPTGSNFAVTPELVHKWFATCIARQFVPTMYKNPELEDKYE